MFVGKARNDWDRTCVLWATILNALQDPKNGKTVTAEDLNPYRRAAESSGVEKQSGFVSRLNLIRALPVDKREAAVQALMRRE